MNRMIAVGFAALLLSACHHDNPLQTHTKTESATFLMNASANAEKRLQFAVKKDERGYGYLECMEGQKNKEINCNALYQAMILFAREGHYKGFDSITLAQLTDKRILNDLNDDYFEVMSSTWPTYY